jgi:2-polyprenyl-3-methyl-5-hydroxy-6-metoxy-1,4-benzoquinol methylase
MIVPRETREVTGWAGRFEGSFMTKMAAKNSPEKLTDEFLEEYNSEESIRRYTRETAGNGISYLLDHDYGEIYLEVLEKYIPESRKQKGIRLWEFGCGGGMNLLHLVSILERRGIAIDCAYGTDFSETLIEAANREVKKYLSVEQGKRVRFCVARNESLVEDATKGLGTDEANLLGSFDLVLGVNTIRYSHRLMNENECAAGIRNLLNDTGAFVVIDMNNRFPAFRSRMRDRLTKDEKAYYLPSLDEYARPFQSAGLEILKKGNFCWIPHSAGPGLTSVMKALTPVLSSIAPSRAMRSLVIGRKSRNVRN